MKGAINGLDLFSGIGGISLALGEWVRPIAYCENDRYAQSVLLSRMRDGELCRAPIWDDVRTLRWSELSYAPIDIIYGGFPCQDISTAGNGAGLEGERSGLFVHIIRLAKEIRPTFIFLENVPAIRTRGLGVVLRELSEIGYDARWTIVSAKEVGAAHLRERWFLLAHTTSKSVRIPKPRNRQEEIHASPALEDGKTANTNGEGGSFFGQQSGLEKELTFTLDLLEGNNWDERAAFFLGVDHGLPHRGHRIKALGNAVVPLQAKVAFKRLIFSNQQIGCNKNNGKK